MDARLLDICADSSRLTYEKERYISAIMEFEKLFGAQEVSIFSAPGRSEVCGNHTDHQNGKVLACSINRDAIAVAAPSDGTTIRIKSGDSPMIQIDLNDLNVKEDECGTTAALIRGIAKGFEKHMYCFGSFDCYVTSDVLVGAGLSSSAAFETVIGNVINGFYNAMSIDAIEIAQIGQYAENRYFGKPCGLMDQMACSVGSLVNIDFAVPDEPAVRKVSLDLDKYDLSLCITDTKGSHSDLTADYAEVPSEMDAAARFFGCEHLRTVSEEEFINRIAEVRDELGDRAVLRALHFFEENKRVDRIVEAIEAGDIDTFLECIRESGDSSYKYLQNVYTCHDITHQNVSLALCISDKILNGGKGAARVHGGGFAGTIQAFVRNGSVEEYKKAMDSIFGEGASSVLKIRKYGGMKVV